MPLLHWDGHSAQVMKLITKLYKNLECFDCSLDTNGGLVHGHKTVLVACSPYLQKLIMDHHGMEIIPFKEVKYSDMKLILDFMYFGEVDVRLTDVPSVIETAQLLQVTSLSSFSLKFLEKSSTNSTSDRNMDFRESTSCANVTKHDNCHLSVQDTKGIDSQDLHHKENDSLTANCESVDLPELPQIPNEIHANLRVHNSDVIKMDKISKGPENFQDELPPIGFVAVSPISIKSEHSDDEQSASCVSHLELKNFLEETPQNCDVIKVTNVQRKKEFQSESEAKIKEKNDNCELDLKVTNNSSFIEILEMNCTAYELENSCDGVTTTIDDKFMNSNSICVEESTQIETSVKTQDSDNSNGSFDERMKDVEVEFESICDISKCDLKVMKSFETGKDNEAIDDNNDLFTLKEVSQSLECEADKISLTNSEQDVNQRLDEPNTKKQKIVQTTSFIRKTRADYEMEMGNSQRCNIESTLDSNRVKGIDLDTHVWSRLAPTTIRSLENGEKASPSVRRRIANLIADYLISEVKDLSRTMCEKITMIISKKYPHSFKDEVNGIVYGHGYESFRTQIYNVVGYRKPSSLKSKRTRKNIIDADDAMEEGRQQVKKNCKQTDEYGCVEYAPDLPEGETTASQEEKRVKLTEYFFNVEADKHKVEKLMYDTYPTQREVINSPMRDLKTVTTSWPFLKDPQQLINHASRLLGFDVKTMWMEALQSRLQATCHFLRYEVISSSLKKLKRDAIVSHYKKNLSSNNSNNIPLTLLGFELLVNYFSEKAEHLYQIIKADTSDEMVGESNAFFHPVLIVRDWNITSASLVEKMLRSVSV